MAKNDVTKRKLISAVNEGNLEEVKHFIASLQLENSKVLTAGYDILCNALEKQHNEIAKLLISKGCPVSGDKCDKSTALHLAVVHGDSTIVKILLFQKRMSVITEDKNGMSPFFLIASRLSVDIECSRILDALLDKKLNINSKQRNTGLTLLHYAAKFGNVDIIPLLLSKKSHLNFRSKDGQTALHVAAMEGQSQIVDLLLERGAVYNVKDANKKTPLCLAVEKGDMVTIEIFFNCIASSKSRSSKFKDDHMLVYCATAAGNIDIVELLIRRGAVVNHSSERTGKTALYVAVEQGRSDIVKLLLERGADPNMTLMRVYHPLLQRPMCSTGYTALHIAAERGYEEIVEILLQHGAHANSADESGKNPLHLAVKKGSLPIVTTLLNSGCDLASMFTPAEHLGYTPLHLAVESGNKEMVRLFLDQGLSVESKTKHGLTPLHVAAQKEQKQIIRILLSRGAHVATVGQSAFEYPFYFAAETGNSEIVDMFSIAEFMSLTSKEAVTASLYIAAYHGYNDIVKKLLNKGADPNANFKHYLSPLHAAAQHGHENIVEMLLNCGAEVNGKQEAGTADETDLEPFSTPLIASARCGHEGIVDVLLHHGANLNAKLLSPPETLSLDTERLLIYGDYLDEELETRGTTGKIGYSPLHFAAESGEKEIIEKLLTFGADVNSRSENKSTPLSIVVGKKEDLKIVQCLLEAGAVTSVQGDDQPVLFVAIAKKNPLLVNLLLKYIACVNFTSMWNSNYTSKVKSYTPLQLALLYNDAHVVELLLRKGAHVNTDINHDFPLHLAVERGYENISIKLIDYGASVNSLCIDKLTPFLHAVQSGRTVMVKLLLSKGASFDTKTVQGEPLIHFALSSSNSNKEMIRLLVQYGADVNAKNQNDLTPLYHILDMSRDKPIKNDWSNNDDCYPNEFIQDEFYLFLECGSDVNTWSEARGKSILHHAAATGKFENVALLLRHDANVNVLDIHGNTPLNLALTKASSIEFNPYGADFEDDDHRPRLIDFRYDDCYNEDVVRYRKVARLLTKAIARHKAAGKDIHQQNLNLIDSKNVKHYIGCCQKEIEKMKLTEISNQITYFDLLVANENKLSMYERNTRLTNCLQYSNFMAHFTFYGELLNFRMKKGKLRNQLLEASVTPLKKVLQFEMPMLIVNEIFSYLSTIDLQNLCNSCRTLPSRRAPPRNGTDDLINVPVPDRRLRRRLC